MRSGRTHRVCKNEVVKNCSMLASSLPPYVVCPLRGDRGLASFEHGMLYSGQDAQLRCLQAENLPSDGTAFYAACRLRDYTHDQAI